MESMEAPRIALVHDWLNQAGGAEVVLEVLHEMFPEAPIFTSLADADRVPAIAGWDLRPSWMDRLPGIHAHHQPYLPLYPLDWSTRRIPGYDLILSNKSGFCHGLRAGGAVHVCYCLTPTRYVWDLDDYLAHEDLGPASRLALRAILPALRRWDWAAAQRVDHFVAISSTVQDRILKHYGRASEVIFPPTDLEGFEIAAESERDDHYLILARLVPYKRIDLAVEAFNQLGRRLVVVGDGRDRARLEAMAGPTIEFRGRLPQAEVRHLLARCRGLVWPGVEDYGLAPVEAMASGRPVIARRAGGVLDTIDPGRTGVFFDGADAAALADAVRAADQIDWQPAAIRTHAEAFGRPAFEARLRDCLKRALSARRAKSIR
jgi:glycosyltransferase involved in cell wall biosynthesis